VIEGMYSQWGRIHLDCIVEKMWTVNETCLWVRVLLEWGFRVQVEVQFTLGSKKIGSYMTGRGVTTGGPRRHYRTEATESIPLSRVEKKKRKQVRASKS